MRERSRVLRRRERACSQLRHRVITLLSVTCPHTFKRIFTLAAQFLSESLLCACNTVPYKPTQYVYVCQKESRAWGRPLRNLAASKRTCHSHFSTSNCKHKACKTLTKHARLYTSNHTRHFREQQYNKPPSFQHFPKQTQKDTVTNTTFAGVGE